MRIKTFLSFVMNEFYEFKKNVNFYDLGLTGSVRVDLKQYTTEQTPPPRRSRWGVGTSGGRIENLIIIIITHNIVIDINCQLFILIIFSLKKKKLPLKSIVPIFI